MSRHDFIAMKWPMAALSCFALLGSLALSPHAYAQEKEAAPDAPVVMLITLPIAQEALPDFLPVMQENVKRSRQEEGNISFDVYRREEGGNDLFLVELWKHQEALDAHMTTPHLKAVENAIGTSLRDKEEPVTTLLTALSAPAPLKDIPSPSTTRNVVVSLYVKPQAREAFVEALLGTVAPSRAAPGNLVFDVYQDIADENALVIVERWESVAAHEAHLEQPYNQPLNAIFESSLARPLGEGRRLLRDVAAIHSDALIPVADFGVHQPIGVAVSADNRLFVGFPDRGTPYLYSLSEVIDGKPVPYPNQEWNTARAADDGHFLSVQDLYVDHDNYLWVLDSKPSAGPLAGKSGEGYFKLVKFNLATNAVERIYHFDDLDKRTSALNDVRIDTKRRLAYFSDPGRAALVVLDLEKNTTRTVLAGSAPTSATPGLELVYEGNPLRDRQGKPFVSHVNGIALSNDQAYFYFKPINALNLYRIATGALADDTLSSAELLPKVEDLGETTITHGLEADAKGNIFLTSSLDYSIKYLTPQGEVKTLVQDSRLIWPDSLGIGSDGYLYFSCAQLNREAQWHQGEDRTEYPYQVFKVKLP